MKASIRGNRRQHLLDAAIRVFAKKGYRAASIADVIEEAEVSRGAFYLYFDSKAAVFTAIFDHFLSELKEMAAREARREFRPSDVRGAVRGAFKAWLDYFVAHRDLAAVMFRHGASLDPDYNEISAKAIAAMYGHWERMIAVHQRMGITRAGIDPAFLRVCLVGIFNQVVLHYIVSGRSADPDRLADQWIEILSRGIFEK